MATKCLSLVLLLSAVASANALENNVRKDACKPCRPSGATNTNPPAVGPDLSSMYIDLLNSVAGIHFKKREEDSIIVEKRDSGMCCADGTDCLNLQGLNIAMCYDKFTTNYILPDGSYGSITTGEYSAKDGSQANLITGNYTKGGETGDIYANNASAKPNTATLSIPPQWTAAGVGSAIPVTDLASIVIYTTTIPGTTFTAPTTVPASTVISTISGKTTAVSTVPPLTITAPTTIAPITTVITTTKSGSVASASHSKGAAGHAAADTAVSFGMSIFTALMYAVYAL